MYGVCRDISEREEVEFSVDVRDSIASANFFVTVGPDPDPTSRLSRAFKIQAEIQPKQPKELYVKFLKGYYGEINQIKAISSWKRINDWSFDFVFQFSDTQVSQLMNKIPFCELAIELSQSLSLFYIPGKSNPHATCPTRSSSLFSLIGFAFS